MTRLEPTPQQIADAVAQVATSGWERSNAASHPCRPRSVKSGDTYLPCQHCKASRNPARWPLFFSSGVLAGLVVWTCSTCKIAQADRAGIATVLVAASKAC